METNSATNWNGKIALKIEMYARAIFKFDDLYKERKEYFNSHHINLYPVEVISNILKRLTNGELDNNSNIFLLTYAKYDNLSLKEIGMEISLEMLEDFEKILSNYRKDLLL